jgi:hypothetical protein
MTIEKQITYIWYRRPQCSQFECCYFINLPYLIYYLELYGQDQSIGEVHPN